jgi:hypothetical protein
MSTVADGIAAISGMTRSLALGIAIAGAASLYAQAPDSTPPKPPAPQTFQGCVQKAPGSTASLIISSGSVCATLKGSLADEKLAGHEIELTGVLTPRTGAAAASIQVNSVGSVGKSCSDVCSPLPPRSRGLHPPDQAIPGTQGGTPGLTAPQPPQ